MWLATFTTTRRASDGSISMEKLIKKATDKVDTPWGLDWFVQAGHGGNGFRNCTLVEDATLDSPAYPFISVRVPRRAGNSRVTIKAMCPRMLPVPATCGAGSRSRNFSTRWLNTSTITRNLPLFLGIESVVPGHEHSSMAVITGQIPAALDTAPLPTSAGYTPVGSGTALAKWEYCFDRSDTDTSRGAANNWDCSVPNSLNSSDPIWNATAQKLVQPNGTGHGTAGHHKSLDP